ncbi:hypothetical protein BDW69DRAFT_89033 [Aspergillus filifer]
MHLPPLSEVLNKRDGFLFSCFRVSSTALKGVSYSSSQASAFQGRRWVIDDDFILLVYFSLSVPILLAFFPPLPVTQCSLLWLRLLLHPLVLPRFFSLALLALISLFSSRLVGVAIVVIVD